MSTTGSSGADRRQRAVWVADRLGVSAEPPEAADSRLWVNSHMARVARRLGLASGTAAEVVAGELEGLLEPGRTAELGRVLGRHGGRVCSARRPGCAACRLLERCPQVGVPEADGA